MNRMKRETNDKQKLEKITLSLSHSLLHFTFFQFDCWKAQRTPREKEKEKNFKIYKCFSSDGSHLRKPSEPKLDVNFRFECFQLLFNKLLINSILARFLWNHRSWDSRGVGKGEVEGLRTMARHFSTT